MNYALLHRLDTKGSQTHPTMSWSPINLIDLWLLPTWRSLISQVRQNAFGWNFSTSNLRQRLVRRVDEKHSNRLAAYQAMGSPK
jgi:hypothetical protein